MELSLLCWALLGAILGYKADLVFNYAMHVNYTLTNPRVKDPLKAVSFWICLLPCIVLGPLSALFIIFNGQFIRENGTLREALNAQPGEKYREDPILVMIKEQNKKTPHPELERIIKKFTEEK